MAFERENFYVARKLMLDKSDLTVECNLSAGVNVAKVLAVSVNCNQSGSETLNGVVNFSGAVDIKLIIMTDDGQINTVCSTCPFSSKFESEKIENGQDAFVRVKVIDYNVESIAGEMVKVAVILQQSGFIVCNVEENTISCHDDEVCTKTDEILVNKYVGSTSSETTVESEINIRENIKKQCNHKKC